MKARNGRSWNDAGRAFLLFLFLLCAVVRAQAAAAILGDHDDGTTLDFRLALLHDPSARLTVADVASATFTAAFRPVTSRDLVPSYTRDALWLRLTLVNPHTVAETRYLEVGPPRLQDIRLYMPAASGAWQVAQNGTRVPIKERSVPSRLPVFPLVLAPGEQRTVYVRIVSGNAIMLHLRLWEPVAFHAAERRIDLINGLQFGALFLFVFYALVLFFGTRDLSFIYFCVMVSSCIMNDVSLHQYGYEYFWPGAVEWNFRSPGILGTPITLGAIFLFVRLLQLQEHMPRWTRVLKALALLMLAAMPGMVWLDYSFWVNVEHFLGFCALVMLAGITFYAVARKIHDARLVLLAFAVTWLVGIIRLAQIFGWLAHDFLIDYSQNWAMLLSGVLLVGLLVGQMRKLREEREQAEMSIIEARIEARIQIEQDVQLRTRELRMARDVAEASSRAKSAFLAQLSHELRTPLHSILGYSGLILGDSQDAVLRRRIEAVQRGGRHLLELIDELLDYARGEAGRLKLYLRPTALRSLLEAVLDETRTLAASHDIVLSADLPDDLPVMVSIDSVRLRQVLINLLANACRHSGGGKVVLKVIASRLPVEHDEPTMVSLWLGVQDDGVGIPLESREKIFDPFEQGVSDHKGRADTIQGMGLGLAISRQLVRLMGGELVCDAAPEGGSLFHFDMRAEVIAEPAAEAMQGHPDIRRYAGPVRRILVVDDMPDNRALLADVLASFGFDLALADSGEAALQMLAREPFDLVITDQLMPDVSGWELLKRARDAGHAMPFIMLSAAMPVLPDGWSPHLVFASILMKPAEPERLADALGYALDLKWETSDRAEPESGPLHRPDPEALQVLREAVEQGRISDIEDWVDQLLDEEGQFADFALAVRDAVRRLDMAGILHLAGASDSESAGPG